MKYSRLISIFSVVVFIACWDVASMAGIIDTSLFPPWHQVLLNTLELFKSSTLSSDIFHSLRRLTLACLFVIPFSLVLAMLLALSPLANNIISPFINFTLPLPKVAVYPLIVVLVGLGDLAKIILIGIGIFYFVFINCYFSLNKIRASSIEMLAHVYRFSFFEKLYHVYFKGIQIDFFTGLKSGVGYGLVLVVVSETTMAQNGIGHFIWRSWDQFSIVNMYSGLLTLCLIGYGIQVFINFLISRRFKVESASSQ